MKKKNEDANKLFRSVFDVYPCPFCGTLPEPRITEDFKGFIVVCPECEKKYKEILEKCDPELQPTIFDAVIEWNKKAEENIIKRLKDEKKNQRNIQKRQ